MAAQCAGAWLRAIAGSSTMRLAFRECGRMGQAPTNKAKSGGKSKQNQGKSKVPEKSQKKDSKGLTGNVAMHAKLFEARGEAKYIRSPEQMKIDAEIAKTYTRNMFRRHIEEEKWLTKKIKLRDQAILALPDELQEEARSLDLADAPLERHIWTEFPPIPGFGEKEEENKDAVEDIDPKTGRKSQKTSNQAKWKSKQ